MDTAPGADTAPPAPLPTTVLLITIDTLREDHIDALYTPFLAELAGEGLVFADFGTQTWTYPGLGAILTGRHPAAWDRESWEEAADAPAVLSASIPTLAEQLTALGWDTAMWSANPVVGWTGLDRGYGTFEEYSPGEIVPIAPELVAWLEAHAERPRFLHVHLNDDHSPHDIVSDTCAAAVRRVDTGVCRWDFVGSADDSVNANADVSTGLFTAESADYAACTTLLRTTYGCEVTRQDEELRALWDTLVASGQIEDALTVVAVDHGEGLLDPWTNHGFDQRMTLVRGWGMVLWPGHVAPGIEARPMAQEDIVPTLGELLGLELPTTGFALDALPETRVRTTFYGGQPPGQPWGIVHAAYNAEHHHVRHADGSCDLYDRAADPGEITDLCGTTPPPAALEEAIFALREATLGWFPAEAP